MHSLRCRIRSIGRIGPIATNRNRTLAAYYSGNFLKKAATTCRRINHRLSLFQTRHVVIQ